ncbi:MAG TPA: proton-conducting membrane transporter, partial [bacterium]
MENSQSDLARAAQEAGVVGAGGAGFPTHVKLQATHINTVIANGAECEPLLANDQAVMT